MKENKVRITLSDPVVVARGPDSREAGWGEYQFPDLFFLPDGRFLYTYEISSDSAATYGSPIGCAVSTDKGATWQAVPESEIYDQKGVLLPNGDRIFFPELTSIPVEEVELPKSIGENTLLKHTAYRMDDFSPGVLDYDWEMIRIPAGSNKAVKEKVKVNWPNRFVTVRSGVLIRSFPRGRVRVGPDGTLWIPNYSGVGVNPKNGGFVPFGCTYLFKSTDMGKSWDLVSWTPYIPDTDNDPRAFNLEGFNENDIAFLPDGSMINLIRSNGRFSYQSHTYLSRSTDNGTTWSKPQPFDWHGVWPTLLTLKCGVTLAGYGRPGLKLRATADPAGLQWDDPIEVVHAVQYTGPKPKGILYMKTCGYCNLYALDDNTAAMVYSDFSYEDENGVPRKTMLYRTVKVEL